MTLKVVGPATDLTERKADLEAFHHTIEQAFPIVDPGLRPFGSRVLVQLRRPKERSEGGIILTDDARETEKWNTQSARVISLGPVAFKHRQTLEPWPEGDWCEVGTFVRVPKYGGDRWEVPYGPGAEDRALFTIFNDLDILGLITGDPRSVLAFV